MTETENTRGRSGSSTAERLMALDALRGFDLVWIVGADELGQALERLKGGVNLGWLARQLHHSPWEGFRFYDLIFPLFVFIMGAAIPFALHRFKVANDYGGALRRVLGRAVLMYALGIFYYGGLSTPLSGMRFVGVLQRLAACYALASLAFLYLRPRGLVALGAALLLGYWALLTFVPVPGFGPGDFAERHNLANWIDQQWLPGRQWNGDHDPEGLLSTIPAVASCLLGVLAGGWLRRSDRSDRQKVAGLALAGSVALAAGWAWGVPFPVIKKIWTSSYVLVAGGWSLLVLAAFYLVLDVWRCRAWARPFVWVGTNALTIYLLGNVIDFNQLSSRLAGGAVARALDACWPGSALLVQALVGVALSVVVGRFLFRRQIFLRL